MKSARDEHLFSEGSKRILCLDGGGIRGLITLELLERVEAILTERQAPANREAFVLSDYFDLIAGTSTGAIIATLLALGYKVARVRAKYEELGPKIFTPWRNVQQSTRSKFDAAAFEEELQVSLNEMTLGSVQLKTGLMVTCKRVDTGSAWIQVNNPRAKYWKYDRVRLLRHLVRASAAAPSYFTPVVLPIGNGKEGLFLDGAMSGHNNPSVAALLYALAEEHKLSWRPGAKNLFMLSLGTGYRRRSFDIDVFRNKAWPFQAKDALLGLIAESSIQAVTTLQSVSTSTEPFFINREIAGLENTRLGGEPLLCFERIDPPIDVAGLNGALGLKVEDLEARRLDQMDNASAANMGLLRVIGRRAAAKIDQAKLPADFDLKVPNT